MTDLDRLREEWESAIADAEAHDPDPWSYELLCSRDLIAALEAENEALKEERGMLRRRWNDLHIWAYQSGRVGTVRKMLNLERRDVDERRQP